MADGNCSKDVNDHSQHASSSSSGSTSRSPLPRPEKGNNNVCPVPLWEREFCRSAYNMPWEKFCDNKRYIKMHRDVLRWDDSGALESFNEAKERFRAKYHGEPCKVPVLVDPDVGSSSSSGCGWNRKGGSGSSWNCFGLGNQRRRDEGQHQLRLRDGGGIQRNQAEGRHQMSGSGGGQQQQQQQGQGGRKEDGMASGAAQQGSQR